MPYRSFITAALRPVPPASAVAARSVAIDFASFEGGALPNGSILVIASDDDPTAHYFTRFAADRGITATLLCIEDFPGRRNFGLALDGSSIFGGRPIYFRDFSCIDPSLDRTVTVLRDVLMGCANIVIGRPSPASLNLSKPLQSSSFAASMPGIVRPVPTVITNRGDRIAEFSRDSTVVKSISSARSEAVILSDPRLTEDYSSIRCPVQLQPRLVGTNIRAHVCGERVFATIVHPGVSVDYRYDKSVGFEPASLPAGVAEWCVMRTLAEGLELSGVDLICDDRDGIYYCLEINPNPGYHYFEGPVVAAGGIPDVSEWLLSRLSSGGRRRM